MSQTGNLFIDTCNGIKGDRPPLWVMRQAGRYLPEYRAVRAENTFREVCQTPELACEVTLQPIRRYAMDAAIIFSDILVVTEAMGVPFEIVPGKGPVMERTIRSFDDLATLKDAEPDVDLKYLADAIELTTSHLGEDTPLIGFAGAPFTLACYLIEGGPSKDFASARRMMYEQPDLMTALLSKIADSVTSTLRAEVAAGARAVQVFDSWGGNLPPELFRGFALPAINKVLAGLADLGVPRILYLGNTASHLEDLSGVDSDVVSIDWRTDFSKAVEVLGSTHTVQGNLDPCALFLPEEELRKRVRGVMDAGAQARSHVFNLGHGILPQVDPDSLGVLVDTVKAGFLA